MTLTETFEENDKFFFIVAEAESQSSEAGVDKVGSILINDLSGGPELY